LGQHADNESRQKFALLEFFAMPVVAFHKATDQPDHALLDRHPSSRPTPTGSSRYMRPARMRSIGWPRRKSSKEDSTKPNVGAWRTWVERAEGPPPSLRTNEREAIARKRVLAAGDLASAPNGMRAVEPRLAKFQSQLREMAEALYQDAVEERVAEAAACARRPGSWRAGRSIGASAGGLLDAVHQVAARDVSGQRTARALRSTGSPKAGRSGSGPLLGRAVTL
jgi:hypothetical protein